MPARGQTTTRPFERLTRQQAEKIKELYDLGYEPQNIAERFGITVGSVRSLCEKRGVRISTARR